MKKLIDSSGNIPMKNIKIIFPALVASSRRILAQGILEMSPRHRYRNNDL